MADSDPVQTIPDEERADLPRWRGYWVAAPTPFTADGQLDEDALAEEIDLYVGHGVHGVLVNGTTGEWFSQDEAERGQVAAIAADTAAGRVPVVAGVTAYTPQEVVRLGRAAVKAGVDGVLMTPPPYVHPTRDEVVAFYERVVAGIGAPTMVYNWPRGAAIDLDVDTLARIADVEGVVAIKESTPDELKALKVLEAVGDRVRFFGRFIHRRGLAAIRELGGDGNIDGGGIGALFASAYFEALWADDLAAARLHSARYEAVVGVLVNEDYSARYASPTAQVKAVMRLLGQPGGHVRPPLLDLDDPEALSHIRSDLIDVGLIEALAAVGQDPRPAWKAITS